MKLLKALVEENSYTENIVGVNKVQGLLEDSFWELGLHTEKFNCKSRGDILVAKTSATSDGKKPMMLVGHADTVHAPSPDYKNFSEKGDILSGPGVFDMKAGLIEMFLVLDALKGLDLLSRIPLRILINSSEENSTPETVEKVALLSEGAAGALVFEIGREQGGIVLERKGIIELWCESKGKESHSGNNFHQGLNAIVPLCHIATEAARLVDDAEQVTVNVAQFSGGSHFCVVPGSAKLAIEVRAGTKEKLEAVLTTLQGFASRYEHVTVRVDTFTPPLNKTPESVALFESFANAAALVGFPVTALPRVGGLSDANIIGSAGIPTIDALGPTGGNAHTRQEFVNKSSIAPRAAAVAAFLADYV